MAGTHLGNQIFLKALNFAKDFIVEGIKPESLIGIDPFRLNSVAVEQPVSFYFELLIEETIYEFNFVLTKNSVLEENLVKISSSKEDNLYS